MSLTVLQKPTTRDVPVLETIITVDSTENPHDAFKKLVDNNIRSAPVYNVTEGKYCGFIDIRDLITFVVYDNRKEELQKLTADESWAMAMDTEFLDHMLKVGARMYDMPIEDCTLQYLSRRHRFMSVHDGASLDEVAKLLSIQGCHRVPVLDTKGNVTNIISQSTIIKYLHAHLSEMKELGAHTVEEAMSGTTPVVSVKATDTVLDAFKAMSTHDIMGVAIVDQHGKFVGNTSASDLKEFLVAPKFTSLNVPIRDFLDHVRQEKLSVNAMPFSITVSPTDTLAYVITMLAATKLHCVFVVDGGRLHSVISLGDILSYAYLTTKSTRDAA